MPSMVDRLCGSVDQPPTLDALESSMTFLAVCTLTEDECLSQLGDLKETLVAQYKAAT